MSEITRLEETVRWPGWPGWYRRPRALAALISLAEQGSVEALLALWRLWRDGHGSRAHEALIRGRSVLERAFEESGRDDLVELARALDLPEIRQFEARVRVGRPPPIENLTHLGWLVALLEGPFQAEAAALFSSMPRQGSPSTWAALLLLAGRLDELRELDPAGEEVQRALEQAGAFLKSRLRAAIRQTGWGLASELAIKTPEVFARELEERLSEQDWTWLLTGLERELPGRAARLLAALQARGQAPAELAGTPPPQAGGPPVTVLRGTEPVFAPDDSWLTLHTSGNRFLLARPDGSEARQLNAWEESPPKDCTVLPPLRAFSQSGQYLAAVWRGENFWESCDHMYSGYDDLYGQCVWLWNLVHLGGNRIKLDQDVIALYPGYDGVLAQTSDDELVALHPGGERWRRLVSPPVRVEQGRFLRAGDECYQLEPWASLGSLGQSAHIVGDRLVVPGDPCTLLDAREMRQLATFRAEVLAAAGRPAGPLVLLTPGSVELRDRDTGRLLARVKCPPGQVQLHPRGEHVLSWHQGQVRLTSVLESEPWAEWRAGEEVRFSPGGHYVLDSEKGNTRIWPLQAYRRLDQLGVADLTRLPTGWEELLKALLQRRWRHCIELEDAPLAATHDIELD